MKATQVARPHSRRVFGKSYRILGNIARTASLEMLEPRRMFSTAVYQYHNDNASDGQNITETLLTPSTVNANQFQKQFTTPVDGQVFSQPLYAPSVNITTGTQQGNHKVVFVATEHDSLYAIDSNGGNILWKRSFLDTANASVNLLNASSITTVPSTDISSSDLTPEIGITSTPLIDPATNTIYVLAKSKQLITPSGQAQQTHYVQTLYAVSIQSGQILRSTVVGDTINSNGNFTYRTASDPYTPGNGDGFINVGGQNRVYFNAEREFSRSAIIMTGGRLLLSFASHGDNGPYHGFMLSYDPASFVLNGVLDTTPNGGLGGIWMGGGAPSIDSSGNIYAITGNGSFNTASTNFAANYTGLPKDSNYGDAFIKVTFDTTHTSPTNQNTNGWGLQITDFFSPFNNSSLNQGDTDLGSGGALVLPNSAGSAAHPHLLVGAGKSGTIYLLDRDNLGGFNPSTDRVVQEAANTNTTGINASFNTPGFFNGTLYYFPGYGGDGRAYSISNGTISSAYTSHTTDTIGSLDGTPSISANGTANGIVWVLDRGSNLLKAYRADNLATQLWTSGQGANNRDQISGTVSKFSVPTVADGLVFVGSGATVNNAGVGYLTTYGPPVPPTSPPAAPSLLAASSSFFNTVHLSWSDNSSNEDQFLVERSIDNGANFTQIGTTTTNATTYDDTTASATTTYKYRVRAYNSYLGGSFSAYTNIVTVTTPQAPPTGNGDGAAGAYYNDTGGVHLSGTPALTRVDPQINFNYGAGGPGAPIGVDNFSVKWTGQVQAQYSETYTFYTESDDGVRLFVNGQTLVDDFNDHGTTEDSGTITLSAGQKYTFEMDFYENGGGALAELLWSSPSTPKDFVPQSQLYSGAPPSIPTNLTGHAASGTEIDLTWNDIATNETGYSLERKDGPTGTYAVIATLPVNSNSYNNTNLLPGTQYSYRVQATNFVGNSAYSNVFTLTAPTQPTKPSNAAVSNVTTTTLHLTWTDNADNEDHYLIQRHIPGGQFLVIATLGPNVTSYDDVGLNPGTEYDYHVIASNVAGNTDFTGVLTATLTSTPTNLAASTNPTSISLTWTAPFYSGDDSGLTYNVYRGTSANGESLTPIATGLTTPNYTDTDISSNVMYYYKVAGVDLGGVSALGSEASAIVNPSATPDHYYYLMLDASQTNLDLWQDSPNAPFSTPTAIYPINTIFSVGITGGTGNDTLTFDLKNGNLPGNKSISFDGGTAGNDTIIIRTPSTGGAVSVGGSKISITSPDGAPIYFSGVEAVQVIGGSGDDSLTQSATPAVPVTFIGGTGNDSLNINAGTFAFTSDPSPATANLTVNDNADVTFAAATTGNNAYHLAALNLGPDATATLSAAADRTNRSVVVLGSLTIDPTASLDITNNDLIIHNADAAQISASIATAFSAGGWTGNGLTSSTVAQDSSHLTTIGILLNTSPANAVVYPTFDNQTTVQTDVLIRPTYYGDADLNGQVDANDYTQIDNGFNTPSSGWTNGDFNYDGHIDGSDFTLIDNTFNRQGAALSNAAVTASEVANVKPKPTAQQQPPQTSSITFSQISIVAKDIFNDQDIL